eukprot:TRINITY_DN23305_c0_g1_i2.p1 TRINITY_DN23305_c0_g1~~TRINITY_DN23305_c0_g1_i2.p1  ORF type:complete len:446 (+),score=73.00 TRINITY_DN23305_c0_g1_i2:62-1399(+)
MRVRQQVPLWRLLLPCLLPAFALINFFALRTYSWRGLPNIRQVSAETAAQDAIDAASARAEGIAPAGLLRSAHLAPVTASSTTDWDPKDLVGRGLRLQGVDAEGPAGVPEGRGCFPDNYPACQAGKEWPKAAQPSRGCLVELFRRPEPIVRSRTSLKSIEVSYLNMPERIPKHKTPPKCADTDEWMKDPIGRPIQASTALLLQRALEVGHPHNGIMDPSYRLPARSCTKPVPKIMHFVWFCKPLPDRVAKRVIDFAIMNPSWRIMILVDVALNAEEAKLLSAPEVVNRPGGAIIVHFLASYTDEFRNMDILRHIRDRSHDPRHLHVCAGMSDVARLEVEFTWTVTSFRIAPGMTTATCSDGLLFPTRFAESTSSTRLWALTEDPGFWTSRWMPSGKTAWASATACPRVVLDRRLSQWPSSDTTVQTSASLGSSSSTTRRSKSCRT